MLMLEKHARMILTDSGGIQKEAYFFGVPCVTLRTETEWTETLKDGWNVVVGSERSLIVQKAITMQVPSKTRRAAFGDGRASGRILNILQDWIPLRKKESL